MHGSISIQNKSFSKIVILKQQNATSVTDASIWITVISRNSNTFEIEHSLRKCLYRQKAGGQRAIHKGKLFFPSPYVHYTEKFTRERFILVYVLISMLQVKIIQDIFHTLSIN